MFRSVKTALGLALLAFSTPATAAEEKTSNDLVVLELFTNPSCGLCLPADKLLAELAERDDILALSYPVGYWAKKKEAAVVPVKEHRARHKTYAKKLNKGRVYSPQLVINGTDHKIGSRDTEVTEAIASAQTATKVPANLSAEIENGLLTISIDAKDLSGRNCDVLVIPYEADFTVVAKKGENKGSTLTFKNTALGVHDVGDWTGESLTIDVPADVTQNPNATHIAILLQGKEAGAISKAVSIPLR